MGYCRQTALPTSEPVALADMKNFLRVTAGDDDTLITGLIQAAREYAEVITARALAKRTFRFVLDSHPYYTDTIQSQLAFPPSYYSLPRYSTTLWNYSQMIKLPFSPVISIQQMRYIGTDGAAHVLNQDTDFILDRQSEPARIFPTAGQFWPADLYVPDAVIIDFTAGYDPNPSATDSHTVSASPPNQQPDSTIVTGVPQSVRTAIMMLVAHWFDNRWGVMSETLKEVPMAISSLLMANAVVDFSPTRG